MLQAKILVDYQKFSTARVIIFLDVADPKKSQRMFTEHGHAIEELAALFTADVIMVEGGLLDSEQIIECDLADAWILLRLDGRNRSVATRTSPQYINLEARPNWNVHAAQEIIRQVKETREIREQVADHYNRYQGGIFSEPGDLERPRIS